MTELYFRFEFDDDVDLRSMAPELGAALAGLDGVAETDADVERMRFTGAEVVAALAVTVLLVRGTKQVVREINRLLPEIARLTRNIKGLKTGYIEVDGKQVRLSDVTDDDLEKLGETVTETGKD